ncbi:MAG: PhoH family protein [Flavobacteriales bacterium]|nr:PhoH family protein [Flavobacteriales bacterium]
MQEKEIQIPIADPRELFGTNDKRLNIIKKQFSKLKIIGRGNTLKVAGEPAEIELFEDKLQQIFNHIESYNSLNDQQLLDLLQGENKQFFNAKASEILVYGPGGTQVRARTANQQRMVESIGKNDMVFAIGPAGTGKTYTAVALAVRALKNKEVKRIILTRPAVEAGENLGFLPGDLKEKLDPYLQPLYDALMDMVHYEKLSDYFERNTIEIAPLAFMRGRTLDKAFVILDEAQNATIPQMKMFLTRMGASAKFIVTGDASQVDLPNRQPSGLIKAVNLLRNTEGIGIVELDGSDVIRHRLVKRIIDAFEKDERKPKDQSDRKEKDSRD